MLDTGALNTAWPTKMFTPNGGVKVPMLRFMIDDAWEADLVAAHHRLGKFETRRWEGRELDQWEVWHRTYHDALIRGCGSPILLQFCNALHDMNYRYRQLFLTTHEPDRDVATEHRAIAEAALARDVAQSCRLLEAHIERTGHNILQSMSD